MALRKDVDHKKGDTFKRICQLTDDNDQPRSLINTTINAQVRTLTLQLMSDLQVTVIDEANGIFEILAADTTGWIVGELRYDIEYTINGTVSSTETIILNCVQDYTI